MFYRRIFVLNNKYTIFNSIFHFIVGMAYSVTIGFGNPILTDLGFSSAHIGILFSASMLFGILLQGEISIFVENKKIITITQALQIEAFISILLGIIMIIFSSNMFVTSIIFVVSLSVSTAGLPTLAALCIDGINAGKNINFGFARAMGSIGYSVLGFAGGVFASYFGTLALFYIYIILNICLFIMIYFYPKYRYENLKITNSADSIFLMIKNNKKLLIVLIAIFLIFFSHNIINNFLNEIMNYVNADQVQYGVAIGMSSFLELPTLIFFGFIIKRFTALNLLKISGIFMTLKVVIETLSYNFTGVFIAQFTQPFAYALFTPAIVYFVNDIVKPDNRIKAQLLIGIASMGIGGCLGNLIGGILVNYLGIKLTLIISSLISLLGAIIFILIKAEKRGKYD